MQTLGAKLAGTLYRGSCLYLSGELGAGKSVLARSIIHTLGYTGLVKSPTYTLIETYQIPDDTRAIQHVAHLDLYRLSNAEELFYLGLDEIRDNNHLMMIEWPENGADLLPDADIRVHINYGSSGGRCVQVDSN